MAVRVIDYRLLGVPDAEPIYRLINTLLDPAIAPAQELATLYQSRWTIETTFAKIKTTLEGRISSCAARRRSWCVRSFGACCWRIMWVRKLMLEAALARERAPHVLSFNTA